MNYRGGNAPLPSKAAPFHSPPSARKSLDISSGMKRKHTMNYYLVSRANTPVQMVRVGTTSNVVIAGEGKGERSHKQSEYFQGTEPKPYREGIDIDLAHSGTADAPILTEMMTEIENAGSIVAAKAKARKRYRITNAKAKAIELLENGSGVRATARLCGVPLSTVSGWRKALVAGGYDNAAPC